MDERRDELERLATFAFEECGTEACHAAITRALARVVSGTEPERLAISAVDVPTVDESSEEDSRVWSLDAFYEALLVELLALTAAAAATRVDPSHTGRDVPDALPPVRSPGDS